jgi:membrane fusion protein (multidrug efflux system)
MSDDTEPSAPVDETGPSLQTTKGITKRHKALAFLLIVVVAGGWLGLNWWVRSQTHIGTDNAFIEARTVTISFKVPGTIKRVMVEDNQPVKRGDLLAELEESDYRVEVAKNEAGVVVAENETGGDYLKAEGARATVQLASARFDQAVLDLKRGEALFRREVIPGEQLERLNTAKRIAESQLKEAQEALKRALTEAGLATTGGNRAKVLQRKAELAEAKLHLSYTRITAPCDGYITRKSIEPGVNIQAGQPLMALVPLQDAWITANYKESQLTHIKPGQRADFTVDAYPGRIFSGRVDSIMAGTGAAFSLLPPENATGNYVKVVQRVPVKIVIDTTSDADHVLRVGMSVIPTVIVDRTFRDVLKGLNPFK